MEIIDLTDEQKDLYFKCLEDWSDEMKEAGNHKKNWFEAMKDKGLRVKLALDDNGTAGGMIQYLPVEHSFVEGKDLYVIFCIWVHGYKKGRGNFQGRGMGKALLEAAEEDAKQRGAKGMAAWGLWIPFWMKASWFRKRGYTKVDREGIRVLLWKPFTDDAVPPEWIRRRKRPGAEPGRVTVTALKNGWCPAMNIVFERARRAASGFGDSVVFKPVDTSDRNVMIEWGISDALYIDGKEMRSGPPPSYRKIRKRIARKVRKL